ncbi:MAG: hypothetical protein ABIH18_05525 [Candidatus Omnitrophota bacterium]
MGPVEALRLALAKEKETLELYQKLAETSHTAKETFLFLIEQEEKHMKAIEDKIYELSQ